MPFRPSTSFLGRRTALLPGAMLFLAFVLPARGMEDRGAGRHSRDDSLFSQPEYMGYISYLASDKLEGRGTGQEGIDKAADFIAQTFKKFDVKPAGDHGTYFQNFTLKLKSKITADTRLAIGLAGRKNRKPAKLQTDYTPFPFSGRGSFKGPVVFVGYGLAEEDFNEYEGLDVEGKVVLVMRRAPKFRDFGFMAPTFRGKARKAAGRDAAAILIVNPPDDEEGDKLFDFESASGGSPMFGSRPVGVPTLHVRRALAERMLESAGLPDLATLQRKIEDTQKPVSTALKGVTAQGAVEVEPVDSPVRNIVGIIPGTGPQKEEIILLGGHYDHLGIRNKGSDGFDSTKDISNGADDNASGTALVMNMAKAYTQGRKPNRTLVLMAFTGEELGLLGSYHFAGNPTIDLSRVVAMLNFDMVGRLKNNKLEVGGMRTGGFEDMVMKLARPYDLNIKDGGGGRGPSDHTSFYNKKIPVLFFFTGTHKQYHQPTDDTPLINGEGAIRICKYAADIIDEIDANPERPKFASDTKRALVFDQRAEERGDAVASADQPAGRAGRSGNRGQRGPFGNRPRLGIRPDMDSEEKGIVIAEIMEGGAAGKAGLKEGDCIVQIGKTKVEGFEDMMEAMGKVTPGEKVTVKYQRAGKRLEVDVQFGEARQPVAQANASKPRVEAARSAPSEQVAELLGALSGLIQNKEHSLDISLKVDRAGPDSFELSLRIHRGSRGGNLPAGRSVGASGSASASVARGRADPHHAGGAVDGGEPAEMPAVRLGIMPTYGEPDEPGGGYEISGVVDGGPAAKAGMKDSDRIYQIGDAKIKDVYSYMDALRKFKPGDEIPVTVIRGGKKITLKIKAAPQKAKEAA